MIYNRANELARDIKESNEYTAFTAAKEKAMQNPTTVSLLKEYHTLQYKAQAAMVAGENDADTMQRLQKLGELLQMDRDASEFLIAEYQLNRMLGDIYKILADAVDVDLSMLEE